MRLGRRRRRAVSEPAEALAVAAAAAGSSGLRGRLTAARSPGRPPHLAPGRSRIRHSKNMRGLYRSPSELVLARLPRPPPPSHAHTRAQTHRHAHSDRPRALRWREMSADRRSQCPRGSGDSSRPLVAGGCPWFPMVPTEPVAPPITSGGGGVWVARAQSAGRRAHSVDVRRLGLY